MTRSLPQVPSTSLLVLALSPILVGLSIAAAMIASMSPPDPGIYFHVEGRVVVGYETRIELTVVWPLQETGLLFLSIAAPGEVVPNAVEDDPWGMPNVWNLTGLDLREGRTFTLHTIPVWGAETVLIALAWRAPSHLSAVEFPPGAPSSMGGVDPQTVRTFLSGSYRLTIVWPLDLRVTAEGDFVIGGEVRVSTTVKGTVAGAAHIPTLLYLSIETKPVYYRILSSDLGDDPWGMPNVWNVTGLVLSDGVQFNLSLSPEMRGQGIPFEARVWSPRGAWSNVVYNQTGEIQTPESIRLWASLTVDFPIR